MNIENNKVLLFPVVYVMEISSPHMLVSNLEPSAHKLTNTKFCYSY